MLRVTALALLAALVLAAPASAAPGALSQPAGPAACISEDGTGGQCVDGAGLTDPRGVAISPDGRNVYVTGYFKSSIAIFARDPTTGALTETGCLTNAGTAPGCTSVTQGADTPERITVSPDGATVYVSDATNSTVSAFPRDAATGALGPATCLTYMLVQGCDDATARALRGAFDVAVSPDGRNVYSTAISDQAVAELKRNPGTGKLTQSATETGCISHDGTSSWLGHKLDNCSVIGGGNGSFWAPVGIAVSPDGTSVLAAAHGSGLQNFYRDDNGVLSGGVCIGFVAGCPGGHGMGNPWDVAVAPDGKAVFVATRAPGGLAVFNRDTATRSIKQATFGSKNGCVIQDGSDGCLQGRSVADARSVATSADGRFVYLAAFGSAAIAAFSRDPDTNQVHQLDGTDGCVSADGSGGLCGTGKLLEGVEDVAVSPDGRNVYAVAGNANAVLVFDREQPAAPASGGGGGPGVGGTQDGGGGPGVGGTQGGGEAGAGASSAAPPTTPTPPQAAPVAPSAGPAPTKAACRKVKAKARARGKHGKHGKATCAKPKRKRAHRRRAPRHS